MSTTLPGTSPVPRDASTTQVAFHVPTMTCGGCVQRVKAALQRVEGVLDVRARFDLRQVTITRDADMVTEDGLRGALRDAGYPAAGDGPRPVDAP